VQCSAVQCSAVQCSAVHSPGLGDENILRGAGDRGPEGQAGAQQRAQPLAAVWGASVSGWHHPQSTIHHPPSTIQHPHHHPLQQHDLLSPKWINSLCSSSGDFMVRSGGRGPSYITCSIIALHCTALHCTALHRCSLPSAVKKSDRETAAGGVMLD
jgi:hypothetical protein